MGEFDLLTTIYDCLVGVNRVVLAKSTKQV